MKLSVAICSHNPRSEYLRRTLEGLKAQTMGKEQWELLLIDNASKEALAGKWDLSWHPNGRPVREDELGLTPARLRGIQESRGEIIIFVDDDNVLGENYLEEAQSIGEEYAFLGAWGGNIRPEFESPPPDWTREFWGRLAVREVKRDTWSNLDDTNSTIPWGAGMCVRRSVAVAYREAVLKDKVRMMLDRRGDSLASSGDCDLALTACDLGMGTGLFRRLNMIHLIPAGRLTEDYLTRLIEAGSYTGILGQAKRGHYAQLVGYSPLRAFLGKCKRFATMKPRARRLLEAKLRGQLRGILETRSWRKAGGT